MKALWNWISKMWRGDRPPSISPEHLSELEAFGSLVKQTQDRLRALDIDPHARVYSQAEVSRMVGLDGFACKACWYRRDGLLGDYHYGYINSGCFNCGFMGIPLCECTNIVFLNEQEVHHVV